ncbi:MAG: hypothetical protein MI750_11060, partial [Xanthomonadales bacterium]|nr:hypothetical protein [Xanthomonadales bacterium]
RKEIFELVGDLYKQKRLEPDSPSEFVGQNAIVFKNELAKLRESFSNLIPGDLAELLERYERNLAEMGELGEAINKFLLTPDKDVESKDEEAGKWRDYFASLILLGLDHGDQDDRGNVNYYKLLHRALT